MIPISSYKPSFSKNRNKMVPGSIPFNTDLETELNRFKNGYYKEIIEACRNTPVDQRQRFKAEKLPSITISCRTKEWRKEENVTDHSGFICFDIDGKEHPHITNWAEIRDKLFDSPHVAASFLSASGNGVAYVCKIIPSQHADVFDSMSYEMDKSYKIHIDPSGRDVVRLRFATYDPDLKMKPDINAVPILLPSQDWIEHKSRPIIHIRPSGTADSPVVFECAIQFAGNKREFKSGEKHWFLMRLSVYCNNAGMSQEYCENMALKKYFHLSDITHEDFLLPIKNVYRSYKSKHGSIPPPKPLYTFRGLKWLLSKIPKPLIKDNIHLYDRATMKGEKPYTIGVSSRLLCFFMRVLCPQYSWTITDHYDEFYTNEQCAQTIPTGYYVDYCNGSVTLCESNQNYPSNWNV